jgi:hypothetical protein
MAAFLISWFNGILLLVTAMTIVFLYVAARKGRRGADGWPIGTRLLMGTVLAIYAGSMFALLEVKSAATRPSKQQATGQPGATPSPTVKP